MEMGRGLRFYFALLVFFLIDGLIVFAKEKSVEEEEYGVKYASNCEVCKYLVLELESRLKETGRTHDVIELGYELDARKKKRIQYTKTELRLVESLEGICDRLLEYNIHKERSDSTRFAKGMSTTFKVLHGLVDKGVKVELGIPYDLWDKPSAEVSHLKTQCENLLEAHEDAIEKWYYHHQDIPLKQYICIDRALRKGDTECLDETFVQKPKEEEKPKKKRKKKQEKMSEDSSGSKEKETKPNEDQDSSGPKEKETKPNEDQDSSGPKEKEPKPNEDQDSSGPKEKETKPNKDQINIKGEKEEL